MLQRCSAILWTRLDRPRRHPIPWAAALFGAGVFVGTALSVSPVSAQTSADSTVALYWTAPGDDGNIGRAFRYELRYRATPVSGVDTLSWWNAATLFPVPAPSPAGSMDSVLVRGLTPSTTYYFIIRTADEVPNWSGYSNLAVKKTGGDATAPGTIADLSVTQVAGASISVRWTAPGDDGNTGTAASYQIRYSSSPITSSNWASAAPATGAPAPAVAGTAQTYVLSGLAGSKTYYIAIKALDEAGNAAALSNVVNGTTTDVIAPAAVRDLGYNSGGQPSGSTAELSTFDVLASSAR